MTPGNGALPTTFAGKERVQRADEVKNLGKSLKIDTTDCFFVELLINELYRRKKMLQRENNIDIVNQSLDLLQYIFLAGLIGEEQLKEIQKKYANVSPDGLGMIGCYFGVEKLIQDPKNLQNLRTTVKDFCLRKGIYGNKSSEFLAGDYAQGIVALFILLRLQKKRPIEDNELKSIFQRFSFFPFVYYEFLQSLGSEEQDIFFFHWFDQKKHHKDLREKGSLLWDHLKKHFGKIELVKNEYKKRFREDLEKVAVQENNIGAPSKATVGSTKVGVHGVLTQNNPSFTGSILAISLDDIEVHMSGDQIILNSIRFLAPDEYLHIVYWEKTKSGKLQHPKADVFKNIDAVKIPFQDEKIIELYILGRASKLSAKEYRDLPDGKRKKLLSAKKSENGKVPKISQRQESVKVPESNILSERKTPAIERKEEQDFASLETFLYLAADTYKVEVQSDTIVFHIDISPDFLEANGLSDVQKTPTVIFSLHGESIELSSFFGIRGYIFNDREVADIFHTKCLEIQDQNRKDMKERENRETQKALGEISYPAIFQEALDFIKGCQEDDFSIEVQKKKLYIWQIPRGVELIEMLTGTLKLCGYHISFSKGENGKIIGVECRSLQNTKTTYFSFEENILAASHLGNGGTQEDIIMHAHIKALVAYLVCISYDRNSSLEKKKRTILERLKERETLRKETFKRIQEGKGSFIQDWEIYEEGKVGLEHPDIENHAILGRRGGLRIGGNELESKTQDSHIDTIREQMFGGKSRYLEEYFFMRIRATLDISGVSATKIKNPTAIKILESFREDILRTTNRIDSDIGEKILNALIDAGVPLQISYPVEFSYHELKK